MASKVTTHLLKNVTSLTRLTTKTLTTKPTWTTMPATTEWSTSPVPSQVPNISQAYAFIVVAMVLSILCLLFVLYVYYAIPEFRNVHGTILVSLCSCLLIVFVFLIIDLMARNRVALAGCKGIAIVIHITFLASFFWTNVMSYDVWKTIVSLKPVVSRESGRRRYWKYSAYAWLMTIAVAIPSIVVDNVPSVSTTYRPNFGTKRCWLNGTQSHLIYFNTPVGIILLSNLIMFSLTANALIKARRRVSVLQLKKQKRRFKLYLKLSIVMGLVWFSEFLPWMTGVYQLYAVAGFLSSLYGVYLFVIFICKKRLLKQIWARWTGREDRASKDKARKTSSQMTELTETANSSSTC